MKIHNKRRRLLIVVLLVTALVAAGILLRSRRSGPVYDIRHIVLISIDTCRADYLSCYESDKSTTPNIDAIAAAGVLFENVISPCPQTLPAHSSMLTGKIPPVHGVHDNTGYKLGPDNTTLAEILKTAGYATGAAVGAFVLDRQFGLAQGFDTYHDTFEKPPSGETVVQRLAGDTTVIAIDWLEKHRDQRFFYFLHYYDPHMLYRPPEPFATQFADDPYAGEIAYTDDSIGKVVQKLKDLAIYDKTLLIVTADHGEMLGEHGELGHGYFIYQGSVHVPMIFKLPGGKASHRVPGIAGIVDIVPTVCSLLRIEAPADIQGIDLSADLSGDGHTRKDRYLFCESLWPTKYEANPLLGIVDGRFKYIQTTRPELYDLSADTAEAGNLVAKDPNRARTMQEKLAHILEASAHNTSGGTAALDAESLKRLQSLGYIGGAVDKSLRLDQSKKDPKDLLQFHELGEQIPLAFEAKNYARVAALARQQIELEPDLPNGYGVLAEAAANMREHTLAIASFTKVIEMQSEQAAAWHGRGVCRWRSDDLKGALADFDRAIELNPDFADAYADRGAFHRHAGRIDQAFRDLSKAVALNPQHAQAWYNRALTQWNRGVPAVVVEDLTKAIELVPQYADALFARGMMHNDLGKGELALQDLQLATELSPQRADFHGALGQVLMQQSQPATALEHYRETLTLKPDWHEVANELAWRLATLEDDDLRNGAEAVELAEKVCEATGYQQAASLDTLAAAYAEAGDFDRAIETAKRAIAQVESAGNETVAAAMREHLRSYQAGQPCREPL